MADVFDFRRRNLTLVMNHYAQGKQVALAERTDLNDRYISQLVTGRRNMGNQTARKIERALRLPEGYMDVDHRAQQPADTTPQNPATVGVVPLVQWGEVEDARTAVANADPARTEAWITTVVPHSPNAYALRVEGDSMQPRFPTGTVLVVDPDVAPRPGDFVIVKEQTGEIVFKRLRKDGSALLLDAANDRYPMRPLGDAKIVGVVLSATEVFLRRGRRATDQ